MHFKALSKLLGAMVLLLPVLGYAQSNYKPGYVVNLKGDTIKGFIDYREWDANPDAINFKKALTDNSTRYGTNDIKNFTIDKLESFILYTGRISTDPVDPDKVKPDAERDTSFRIATVFLKVLEKGNNVTLFSYKDDLKIRFYIGESPGYAPKELIFKVSRVHTENTFQKQLSGAALRYNELTDNIKLYIGRSQYDEDDLISIVNKINHVTNEAYKKDHYNGSAVNFFAGAGININTTSPSTAGPYYTAGGTSYTSALPMVSLGMNLFANPATRKLEFRVEVSAAQGKYKSLYMSKVLPYEPTEASFSELILSVSPQVIYNFYNADNFKVFAGAGVVFSDYQFSNAYYGSQNHDGSESTVAANNPFVFNTDDDSFIIKAGIQFSKHLAIYGGVQSKVAATQGGYFKLSSGCDQFGINYIF